MASESSNSTRQIRDLALIGNRRSAAAIDRRGDLCFYAPGRFDRATLFAGLLDPAMGSWTLRCSDPVTTKRDYVGESAVLRTELETARGRFRLCDWMPVDDGPERLCRRLEEVAAETYVEISPRPDYGQSPAALELIGGQGPGSTVKVDGFFIHSSLVAEIDGDTIRYRVRKSATAWFVLTTGEAKSPTEADLDKWLHETLSYWDDLHNSTRYQGPYERELKDSLRALRLLTHRDSGGILAAGTFGLPEVPGGARNYDYRYVWLRDAGMIVSALTRAGSDGKEERRFLEFLCSARRQHDGDTPLPPFVTLDGGVPPRPRILPWRGFDDSRPVLIGNGAGQQLQLDGLANVLLAAKLIYNAHGVREHWSVVAEIADYLVDHWRDPDHGIWEESGLRQYTTGKVASAVALHFIADHASPEESERAARWRGCVRDIRRFVEDQCLTSDGAYAVAAGSEAVDISAVLYPIWDYCKADSPQMLATIARLERDSSEDGLLYRRHLECDDADREGVFIAGTLWMAQYWIMRRDLQRVEKILRSALGFSNDLGLFAEEGDGQAHSMLGNFPQSFVHAALIGLLVDYRNALNTRNDSH